MKKTAFFILLAICLLPERAKAVYSDVISVFSDKNAPMSALGKGDVNCSVDGILDGETGWSACYSSTWDTACLKNGSHCELCFVEDPEICQYCGAGYAVVDDEGNNTGNHCEKLNSAGCLESFSAYENCAKCASGGKTCSKCNSGYTLQNGKCAERVVCPSNCAECDSSGVCAKCNNGYVLKNGACAVKPKTQIAFCPPDKTLSADLCCCISQ